MKMKFFLLLIVLCLALCACGGNNTDPTTSGDTAPEITAEPTNKGLFVDGELDDEFFTLPEEFQGIELPVIEFDDDETVVLNSRPLTEPTETDPDETEETAAPTEAPTQSQGSLGPNDLPTHEWE